MSCPKAALKSLYTWTVQFLPLIPELLDKLVLTPATTVGVQSVQPLWALLHSSYWEVGIGRWDFLPSSTLAPLFLKVLYSGAAAVDRTFGLMWTTLRSAPEQC